MTSDQFVDVDDSAAQALPAPPASRLTVPSPSATEQARMDEDADLLSDRDVVRLFTTGRRPTPVRMWFRRLSASRTRLSRGHRPGRSATTAATASTSNTAAVT